MSKALNNNQMSDIGLDLAVRDQTMMTHVDTHAPSPGSPADFNLDDYAGYTWAGKPIIDLDGVESHLDTGLNAPVHNGVITYSFTDLSHLTGLYNNPNYGFAAPNGFSPFSAEQRDQARDAIQLWDDLIAPTFVEKNGHGADIQFANSYDPAQAYSYYPGDNSGQKYHSDVFVADPSLNPTNVWFGPNGYGATTLVHELGHTLGLSHPGAYNYDPDLDLTYANYAEYAQDSNQYSIMSYWNADETGSYIIDWSTFFYGNPQTPMLHDVLTIQDKYGADPTTRAGDTVYGFNSNAGNALYDFNHNPFPYLTIYDAGGNDTLDFSGFHASMFIDLHAGEFSSAAQAVPTADAINAKVHEVIDPVFGEQPDISQADVTAISNSYIAYNAYELGLDTGVAGVNATEYNNISIAYGTVIENAIGGSARDVLWGNEVDNVLKGGAGKDVLDGFEGADTLYGGAGNDTFQFHNLETHDKIMDFATGVDHVDVSAFGFTDFIGNAAFDGNAGELRFDHGVLSGDLNGDGIADFAVEVHGSAVHAGDLIL
jgi:serralysin